MIDYIKKYDISNDDFCILLKELDGSIIELLRLHEGTVKSTLEYLCDLGVKGSIKDLIIKRPDLILLPKKVLEDYIKKIDIKVFINVINNNIEDLILLGI